MRRRDLLGALLAAGVAPLAACGMLPGPEAPTRRESVFVPGYHPDGITPENEPADSRRRRPALGGQKTMLTKVEPDGTLRQAVFPIIGHDVAIAPDRSIGFLGRMGNSGNRHEAHHVLFDPETLALIATGQPLHASGRGGGHGVFTADGALLTTERAPAGPYAGRPEAHFGRIAIRDPQTLRIRDSVSCHGIDPHEIRVSDDGTLLYVANYGSVADPGARTLSAPRRVVEASVTAINLASGALVDKIITQDPATEMRHLALGRAGQVFGIRARLGPAGSDAALQAALGEDVADLTADAEGVFLPAAPVLITGGQAAPLGSHQPQDRFRHGLSVEYDGENDEFLATFPSSHRLMAFDARTGAVRHSVDTRGLGLRYPCGIALLSGGVYAVAGHWQDMLFLQRGSHRVAGRMAAGPVFTGHSHMTAA